MFNISFRKVGGLTFVKVGRLTFSFSISREYRPFGAPVASRAVAQALAPVARDPWTNPDGSALWPAYQDRDERARLGT